MKNYKLKRENALILFVDIQDKLLDIMQEKEEVLKKAVVLAKMANIMQLETLFTEQYPKGLGHTNKGLFDSVKSTAIEKTSFSCMLEKNFTEALTKKNKKQIIISGIETHICVLLTVRDLIAFGYEVFVCEDAVSSRDLRNKHNALHQMNDLGAVITNVESVMFDLNSVAGTDEFKAVQKLIV